MILENQVIIIKWTSRNKNKFESLGYTFTKIFDNLEIKVEHLNKGSHQLVKYKCDNCGEEGYRQYRKLINKDKYYCKKCSKIEKEETCIKRYGVKNTFQSEEKKDRIKQTLLKRYGVDSPLKSKEIKNKMKQTCINKYGEDNYMKTDDGKKHCKEALINKYGENYHKDFCSKAFKTLHNNNSKTLSSKNQIKICEWINGTLNYKIK